MSVFEFYYDGKTPGKFIMKLKVVSSNGNSLPLITYFKRSATLTYFISSISLFLFITFKIFINIPLYGLIQHYATYLFLAFLVIPAIITKGSQCGHDYLLKTAVISNSSKSIRLLNDTHAYMIFTLLALLVTGAIYFVHTNKNKVVDVVKKNGFLEMMHTIETEQSKIIPETPVLQRNVDDDFFEYYDDLHGFIGLKDLSKLDNRIGIQTPLVFTFDLKKPRYVPFFQVFVTKKGLENGRFKNTVTRNLLEHSIRTIRNPICIVKFIYRDDFFKQIYISKSEIQIGVYLDAVEGVGSQAISPAVILHPRITTPAIFSNDEIPLWKYGGY